MKSVADSGLNTPVCHPSKEETDVARCLWENQAQLIQQAAAHFALSPSPTATLLLPVLFQAIAPAQPDKRAMKRLINEVIDKGFDDWLRSAPVQGGVQ